MRGFLFLLVGLALAGFSYGSEVRVAVLADSIDSPDSTQWSNTINHLSQEIPGSTFSLVTMDKDSILAGIKDKSIQLVIADAATIVWLEESAGANTLATHASLFNGTTHAWSGSALFCLDRRRDIQSPANLKNMHIAAVSSTSFYGYQAALRNLIPLGIDPQKNTVNMSFLGTSKAVVEAVGNGQYDAGIVEAGELETLESTEGIVRSQFRVLWFDTEKQSYAPMALPFTISTELYPRWSIASTPAADPDLVRRVSIALLSMPFTPSVMNQLMDGGWALSPSFEMVRRCMRDLRLPPYENFKQNALQNILRQYRGWILSLLALFIAMGVTTLYVSGLNRTLTVEINHRRKAEAALAESLRRFEHIADCSADWIWETDDEGRLTYVNNVVQIMLGYQPSELIGMKMEDLFATAERDHAIARGLDTFGTGKKFFRERFRYRTKDGRVVIHESTAAPVAKMKGVCGYRGVNRDITSQVRIVRLS